MEFSAEELVALRTAVESRIDTAGLHLKNLDNDSGDKLAAQRSVEVLLKLKEKLASIGADMAAAGGLKQSFDRRHILLVDDNESIRKHMIVMLKRHGFTRFEEAENGYVAIEKIKTKTIPYDLILCDMNMPIISGMDVLRLVREEGSCAKIPFIMVTSESNKEILVKAIKAGVSDFVAKPVDEEMLLKKIRTLLQ